MMLNQIHVLIYSFLVFGHLLVAETNVKQGKSKPSQKNSLLVMRLESIACFGELRNGLAELKMVHQ
jgi:hypothetical protein